MGTVTHIAGIDESNHTAGRYRSLCAVTCRIEDSDNIRAEVRTAAAGVTEIKWNKLKNNNQRDAASRAIDLVVERVQARRVRVDALTWDTQDSRHARIGRDDRANLERMYYHLLGNALTKRWGDSTIWRVHPDEADVDWNTLVECLHSGVRKRVRRQPSALTLSGEERRVSFGISEIRPQISEKEPLVQLADLFAGLSAWAASNYGLYQRGKHEAAGQQAMCFVEEPAKEPLTNRERYRCEVLSHLMAACSAAKLPISLDTKCRLETFAWNKCALNFWFYEVQHSEDRAPTRGQ